MKAATDPTRVCYSDVAPVGNPSCGSICGYLRQSVQIGDEPFSSLPSDLHPSRVVRGSSIDDLRGLVSGLTTGDVLVVPSLDHLAVSMWKVFGVLDDLRARGIAFVALAEGVDTRLDHVAVALDIMRMLLDTERRLVARRTSEALAARNGQLEAVAVSDGPDADPLLERSRRVAAPWIEVVREHRPHLTWDQLVERVTAAGLDVSDLSAALMRRHVRRLVAAGDLPASVMERAPKGPAEGQSEATRCAKDIARADPSLSLRDIGARLVERGILPPRADAWSAQTVKRLLDED